MGSGARTATPSRPLGDRGSNEVPPLAPGAVVVADPGIAEQIGQDEPGEARPLADPAVGDDVVGLLEADLALVDRAQLLGRLERAVLVDRAAPGDVLGTRDVAAAE